MAADGHFGITALSRVTLASAGLSCLNVDAPLVARPVTHIIAYIQLYMHAIVATIAGYNSYVNDWRLTPVHGPARPGPARPGPLIHGTAGRWFCGEWVEPVSGGLNRHAGCTGRGSPAPRTSLLTDCDNCQVGWLVAYIPTCPVPAYSWCGWWSVVF